MAQISNVDSDFSGRRELEGSVSPGGTPDDGRKQSLLSKVKDKAKGTVRKIKKIAKKDGSGQTGDSSVDSDDESEEWSASQNAESVEASTPTDVPGDGSNTLHRPPSFKNYRGILEENLLSSFARSDESANSPLVAVPTSYSDGRSSVGENMPSEIIEPISVSEVGEENSKSLGEIPEAKDQEQTAVSEVVEGDPDSDSGRRSTFNQKDLLAIDGLPKPQGFDIDNQSSVKSNFSVVSSDSGLDEDETPERETGHSRDLPSDALPNLDSKTPHPPAPIVAELQDSMFHSKASGDMIANVPSAGEAKYATVIGTLPREPEQNSDRELPSEALQNLDSETPHPAASSVAGFQDSMFHSKASSDISPNEPTAGEAKYANVIGTLPREPEQKVEEISTRTDRELPSEALQSLDSKTPHPPASVVAEFQDSMFHSKDSGDIRPNEPAAGEAKYANVIGTLQREPEQKVEEVNTRTDRELPSEALQSLDSKTPHPPASVVAEFQDSMFHSKDSGDIRPNEPAAGEAKYANVIGTLPREPNQNADRELPSEALQNLDSRTPHPPASSVAEFQDSMFHSKASSNIHPNEPEAGEAKYANVIGTLPREREQNADRELPSEALQNLESETPSSSIAEFHDSMFHSNASSGISPNEPIAGEAKYANVIGKEVSVTPDREFSFQDPQNPPVPSEAELSQASMFSSEASNDATPNDPAETETGHIDDIGLLPRDADSHETSSKGRGQLPSTVSGGAEDMQHHGTEREVSSAPHSDVVPQPDDSEVQEADTYFDASSDNNILLGQQSLDSDRGDDLLIRD